jgi:hypothetical protein
MTSPLLFPNARQNQRRIGRIAIAGGRDAVDVPISMVVGCHRLERFTVVTEELKSNEKVNPRMRPSHLREQIIETK